MRLSWTEATYKIFVEAEKPEETALAPSMIPKTTSGCYIGVAVSIPSDGGSAKTWGSCESVVSSFSKKSQLPILDGFCN